MRSGAPSRSPYLRVTKLFNFVNMPLRKYCIVPYCGNTSKKCPSKLFFLLPFDYKRRRNWLAAVDRTDQISPLSHLHVCEDHFDLENDMVSYMKYKMVGGNLKLKKHVVPHKFECHKPIPDEKKLTFISCDNYEDTSLKPEDVLDLLQSKYYPPDDDTHNKSSDSDDYSIENREKFITDNLKDDVYRTK